jgi:prefoldin alpha subunit
MANPEELQQKYMQFQMIQQQLEELNKALESVQEQKAELEISLNAVKEIEKAHPNSDFLAPLANGVFIKGKISETQKLVVNVGSNVTVERTPEEVTKLLEKQQDEILQQSVEIQALLTELNSQMMGLYKELQESQE